MAEQPVVLAPLNRMGLDVARALGRRGIPVYGFHANPTIVERHSKYCHFIHTPDPEQDESAYLDFVEDWGRRNLSTPAVLYPLNDEMVVLHSAHRDRLQNYYQCVMPPHQTLMTLLGKEGLAVTAAQHGIPAPKTVFPTNLAEVEALAPDFPYPAILKPTQSAYWHQPEIAAMLRENVLSGRAKVSLCHTPQELIDTYRAIAAYNNQMIIQEVIPGVDENLVYISFYLNRQSEPMALFAGKKHRVLPVGFGPASYVRSFYDPALEELALKLLSATRYQGLGGLEFKKDPRDGQYKLVEFNTRFGLWDSLGIQCGVNIPYTAYLDTVGQSVEPQLTYRKGVIWVDLLRDLRAFWMYNRRGQMSLRQWLASLRGEKMWAFFSWDDWQPGVSLLLEAGKKFIRRLLRR